MSSIDLDQLLRPVSDESPCGEDLEYDPQLAELEQASKGKPEQEYGDTIIDAEEPDWKTVKRIATDLLLRTKDLRIALHLGNACLSLHELEGFRDVTILINNYLSDYWDGVHPQLDADDDNDPTERVNAVAALTAPAGTLSLLRGLPLVSLQGVGEFSIADIETAKLDSESEDAPTLAAIDGAFQDCDIDQLTFVIDSFDEIRNNLSAIENRLTMNVGVANAVDLSALSGLIEEISRTLAEYLQKRSSDSQEVESDTVEPDVDSDNRPSPQPTNQGEIRGREDVIRAIDRICEYYEKYEPSSPLPLLLHRAKRLATKSFMEIIKDLTPDALSQASSIGGIDPTHGGDENG